MKSDWEKREFQELYSVPSRNGLSKPSKIRGNGYKMINMGELFANDRIYDIPMELVPLKDKEKELSQVFPCDLLFARQSLVASGAGKCSIVMETSPLTVFESHLIRVRLNTAVADPFFYYYYFKSDRSPIKTIIQHSVQAGIKASDLAKLAVDWPPLATQKRIAQVLRTFDDKIELNNRINENLFQQAQALYKDRFVDMQPFDGEMPADWHLGTVSEIIELHDSKRIPLSSRERANLAKVYPYYGATSVMDYVDRYLFDGIYLLLGEDGTVVDSKGFPILQYVEGKFWVNNHAHIITGKNGFTVETLYLLFSLTNVQSIVTGAVQPKISQANLNKVPVIIPSKAELSAFDSIAQPIFAQIRNLRAENDRLAAIRDTLLPRLMSGELDVSDIDL